jgi:hypothetical protein
MAALASQTEVDLWVPRDAMGDLESGVRAVVADVDGVASAEVTAVTDVTPRSTDIRVTATVWVVLAEPVADPETTADTLAAGFGIMDATVLVTDPADA